MNKIIAILTVLSLMLVTPAVQAEENPWRAKLTPGEASNNLSDQLVHRAQSFCAPNCALDEFDSYLLDGPDGLVGVKFNASQGPRTFYLNDVVLAGPDLGLIHLDSMVLTRNAETVFLWPELTAESEGE